MNDRQNPSEFWDNYFLKRKDRNQDLEWGFSWLRPHIAFLRDNQVKKILEIGCGTGSDCIRLTKLGFEIVGIDVSEVGLKWAREKAAQHNVHVLFEKIDITKDLPFDNGSFDAVISHLALHGFSNIITREVFDRIWHLLKPEGFLVFEVNSFMDIRYRPYKRIKKLEPFFFLEEHGQPMHFFTKRYIKSLLRKWRIITLKHFKITSKKGTKCVWNCLAQK